MAAALHFSSNTGPKDTSLPISRLFMAGMAATAATLALFVMMERMIRVDTPALDPVTERNLTNFIAQKPEVTELTPRPPVEPPVIETPPPANPVATATITTVGLPFPEIEAVRPNPGTDLDRLQVKPISVIGPKRANAIRHPRVEYPRRALMAGIAGTCDVAFSLDIAGRPFNVDAQCSDRVFVSAAEKAVSGAQFSPARGNDGKPVTAHGFVYPLDFTLTD